MNSKGPSLTKKKRPLATCSECQGRGTTKGLFFEMTCPGCNGGGVVDKQTGQALDPEVLVLELRMRLNDRANTITRLEAELADLEPYRRQKQQADLAKAMYPRDEANGRAKTRRGGYGD